MSHAFCPSLSLLHCSVAILLLQQQRPKRICPSKCVPAKPARTRAAATATGSSWTPSPTPGGGCSGTTGSWLLLNHFCDFLFWSLKKNPVKIWVHLWKMLCEHWRTGVHQGRDYCMSEFCCTKIDAVSPPSFSHFFSSEVDSFPPAPSRGARVGRWVRRRRVRLPPGAPVRRRLRRRVRPLRQHGGGRRGAEGGAGGAGGERLKASLKAGGFFCPWRQKIAFVLYRYCTVCVFFPQPPTVVCKMEAPLEYMYCNYTLHTRLAPICMLSRCLLAKFLHQSSVRSLFKSALLVGSCHLYWSPYMYYVLLNTWQLRWWLEWASTIWTSPWPSSPRTTSTSSTPGTASCTSQTRRRSTTHS